MEFPRIEIPTTADRLEGSEPTTTAARVTKLPATIKHMSGHHNGVDSHFTNEVLPHFNIISGTSNNASFLNQIRSQGKVYAHHVSNPSDSASASQLVSLWRAPFDSGVISDGHDAIIIDEIHPETNGTARSGYVASALQQLRALYPNKIILVWTRWQLTANPSPYSTILKAIRDYADLNLIEQYLREGNANLGLIPSWADNIKTQIPGLLSKSIYGLYISQEGFCADESTNVGYWGYLDEQFHRIRNDVDAASMPGIGFWVYYRSYKLTTAYVSKLVDHYYSQGKTSYFGDGRYNQFIENPQFHSGTEGWTLNPGFDGSVHRVAYSSIGIQNYHDTYKQASHGTHALRMVRGSGASTATYRVGVTGGVTHTVSARVYAEPDNARSAKIRVTKTNGQLIDSRTVSDTDSPVGQSEWKRILFHFNVPQGISIVDVILTDESVSQGTTLYWDFVELEDAFSSYNQTPTKPGTLSATSVQHDRTTINWPTSTDPDDNSITYELKYREEDLSGNWRNVHSITQARYTITGLKPKTSYRVYVKASDGQDNSKWRRAYGLFTTTVDTNEAPTQPGGLSATSIQHDRATINWPTSTDPDGNSITYELKYREEDLSGNWSNIHSITQAKYTITGLKPKTSYRVYVKASDGQDNSKWRRSYGLFTTIENTNEQLTSPNQIWAKNIHANRAVVAWKPPMRLDDDLITYDLQSQNNDHSSPWSNILRTTKNRYMLRNLDPSTNYHVRFRTTNGTSTSSWHETTNLFTTTSIF